MLHYYPVKRVYHPHHLDLSVEVNESMASNDDENHRRSETKRSCWTCFFCFKSAENDDNFGSYEAPKTRSDRITNYQSHSRPRHIDRYQDSRELRSSGDGGGFSQSCPSAITQQPRQSIYNQQNQRDSRLPCSPVSASAQSPQRYPAVSRVPEYAGHQVIDSKRTRPEPERSHIYERGKPRKHETEPISKRPKNSERWALPEGRGNEIVHRSPTREEPATSFMKRERISQVRAKSEYVPQRRTSIDDYSGDNSSAVYRDISAMRSSAYSPYEVSFGSQSMPSTPPAAMQNVSRNTYSKQQPFSWCKVESMPVQSRVRLVGKDGRFIGGTIIWTGIRDNDISVHFAVIRLDQFSSDACNGVFYNQKLVNQIENNRYLLMDVRDLLLFILKEGDYCYVSYGPKELTNRKGFLRNRLQTSFELHPVDTSYTEPLRNISRFPDYYLTKIPTPVSDDISENVGPITLTEFNNFLGRNKGIQGKVNSCYLDTLLFSVFAFSADLDDFLFNNHSMVVSHLRHSIILPLRACHFVADAQVEYLRRALSTETKNPKFETEARDIPECLEALFGSILRIPPPLHVGSANFFNETFAIETFGPAYIRVPTFQDFLDHSSVLMDFCFREIPKYFFLQFPREAYHSSIVIPSLELELNDVLYRSVKECSSCGRNATLQFPQLAEASGLRKSFLCQSCAAQRGLNVAAARQLPEPVMPDGEEPDSCLMLTAVLCIELSHYNCFARCEDRWVFFDSMSDQEELFDPQLGKSVTFNIPEVRSVPNFVDLIYGASESLKEHGSLDNYLAGLREDHLVRLFKCAYIAIYSQARHS